MWWIGIIIGTISVSLNNLWMKNADISSIKNFLFSLPILIFINYCFWYSYSKSPAYLWAWLVSIIVAAICSISIETFILKEVVMTPKIFIGILLIISGLTIIKL